MDCKYVTGKLSSYLDRELPPEQSGRVEGHLAVCAGCSRELERLRAVSRLLEGLPGIEVSAGLERRVLEEAARRILAQRRVSLWSLAGLRVAAARAAAVLVLATGLALGGLMGDSASSTLSRYEAAESLEGAELAAQLGLVGAGSIADAFSENADEPN